MQLAAAIFFVEVLAGVLQTADPLGSVSGFEVLEEIFYLLWTFWKKCKKHRTSAPNACLTKIGGGGLVLPPPPVDCGVHVTFFSDGPAASVAMKRLPFRRLGAIVRLMPTQYT